jgi:hypothetical protein
LSTDLSAESHHPKTPTKHLGVRLRRGLFIGRKFDRRRGVGCGFSTGGLAADTAIDGGVEYGQKGDKWRRR